MAIDLDRLTKVLNTTAQEIKEASEKAVSNPMEAISFVPKIMERFKSLSSFGDLGNIKATSGSDEQINAVRNALQNFLQNTKEAQEKVGAMAASLFANPAVKGVYEDLERVKASLDKERGGKVVETSEIDSE